jgi:hypothetical protein
MGVRSMLLAMFPTRQTMQWLPRFFVIVAGLVPATAIGEPKARFDVVESDCAIEVSLAPGSSVAITQQGDLEAVMTSLSTTGDCTRTLQSTGGEASLCPPVKDCEDCGCAESESCAGTTKVDGTKAFGGAGEPLACDAAQTNGDAPTDEDYGEVLLTAISLSGMSLDAVAATIGALESAGADKPHDPDTHRRLEALKREKQVLENKHGLLNQQLEAAAAALAAAGNVAGAERLRSQLELSRVERAGQARLYAQALADLEVTRATMADLDAHYRSAFAVLGAGMFCAVAGFAWSWFRRRRRLARADASAADVMSEYLDDLSAQFGATRWIPYATIVAVLISGAWSLLVAINIESENYREVLVTSLTAFAGCIVTAGAVVKWRGDAATELSRRGDQA